MKIEITPQILTNGERKDLSCSLEAKRDEGRRRRWPTRRRIRGCARHRMRSREGTRPPIGDGCRTIQQWTSLDSSSLASVGIGEAIEIGNPRFFFISM